MNLRWRCRAPLDVRQPLRYSAHGALWLQIRLRCSGLPSFRRYERRTTTITYWRKLLVFVVLGCILVGCGATSSVTASAPGAGPANSGRVDVVAAENFWGSIAAQLGGVHANVTSLISNPNTDPHAYEPTPRDGRSVAQAGYVIANGAGYDPWMPKLVDANPASARRVLTVANLAGRKDGDNPHMWYSPSVMAQVADRITADYQTMDPADAAYFIQQKATFDAVALQHYNGIRALIRNRYGGVPVGATESLFVDLARDLHLDLTTPPDYMKAISEGTDPAAGDKATFDAQLSNRQIKLLVFNRQNATPDIQALVDKAHSESIPVVAITETLDPPQSTFQDWQSGQLEALRTGLAKATGR